jgi:hypothetical protein
MWLAALPLLELRKPGYWLGNAFAKMSSPTNKEDDDVAAEVGVGRDDAKHEGRQEGLHGPPK